MPITVYTLKTCDTCRKAIKWLRENEIDFNEIPIREAPPNIPQLRLGLAAVGGEIRKLFNISGQDYRTLGLKEKLANLSENQALELLSTNGNLIKRPFLSAENSALVGFKADEWQMQLG